MTRLLNLLLSHLLPIYLRLQDVVKLILLLLVAATVKRSAHVHWLSSAGLHQVTVHLNGKAYLMQSS